VKTAAFGSEDRGWLIGLLLLDNCYGSRTLPQKRPQRSNSGRRISQDYKRKSKMSSHLKSMCVFWAEVAEKHAFFRGKWLKNVRFSGGSG
jgi:hypothetical protein